jgi:hypothetical protein
MQSISAFLKEKKKNNKVICWRPSPLKKKTSFDQPRLFFFSKCNSCFVFFFVLWPKGYLRKAFLKLRHTTLEFGRHKEIILFFFSFGTSLLVIDFFLIIRIGDCCNSLIVFSKLFWRAGFAKVTLCVFTHTQPHCWKEKTHKTICAMCELIKFVSLSHPNIWRLKW